MDEKWKQELSSQFAGAGSHLAETDPEWVEIAARFSRQEVPEASQLTQREQLLCILSALLGCQGTTDAASRFEKGLAKQVELFGPDAVQRGGAVPALCRLPPEPQRHGDH